MSTFTHADRLHRLIKEALDRGTVGSIEEAEILFRGYRLVIEIGATESCSISHQATLLTLVALAQRVFLGGVRVLLKADTALKVPLPLSSNLRNAIVQLGGSVSDVDDADDAPRVIVGGAPRPRHAAFEIRTFTSGWRGGIVPIESASTENGRCLPLAAMLSAALAVNEAFLHVRRENAMAGHRTVGLSLWDLDGKTDWLDPSCDGPPLTLLPSRLWLLGLGHLGQAFLWGLGLLPYDAPSAPELVLQDIDVITPSTPSTSLLSSADLVGQNKTRAMAAWAERRGFSTRIHERMFAAGFQRLEEEPAILLCGLDNALGRRALDQAGFDLVVEAGLGRGYQDFRTLRLHTLPSSRTAAQIWPQTARHAGVPEAPAYARLLAQGTLDQCGVTLLAGKAVGAPFVGAVAATLVLAEVLRILHGGRIHQVIDFDLQWPDHREAVLQTHDFSGFNPGFLRAATG
jgi:hypothetical protein